MSSFTHNLNIISRCTQMERSAMLKDAGLSGGQVPYLLRLCRKPGLPQEEIARELYLNKSSVARQIAALERQGFVRREPSPEDRRQQLVYPTEKALRILPELRKTVRSWNEYLLQELSEEEKLQLQAVMERISLRARVYIEREVGWDS